MSHPLVDVILEIFEIADSSKKLHKKFEELQVSPKRLSEMKRKKLAILLLDARNRLQACELKLAVDI